ncbi:hypothetical protein HA402_005147 [Bradysia odoriphaga]|nr:hypothetical protein HA402_005147 [Bradysia odoriphaga]
MRLEVHSAADFLMNLLRVHKGVKHSNSLPENQLQHFKGSLQQLLVLHFRSHWYPDVPAKGSGYRCIRINGQLDPLVEKAGSDAGLLPRTLRKMLPPELTLWIDPAEVSYRIGENGSICVLYDSQSRSSPSSDLDSTGSGTMSDEFIMERVGRLDLTDMQLMDFLENKNVGTPTKARPNNSLGSSGSDDSQLSPPLSPPFQLSHNRVSHYHNNNNGIRRSRSRNSNTMQHQMNYMDSTHLYHNWDNGFSNTNNNINKVRTQC